MSLSDEKLAILERFSDSDVQELVKEVKVLRKVIRSLYGNIGIENFAEFED